MSNILKFKRKKPVSWDQLVRLIDKGPYRETKLLNLLALLKNKKTKANDHKNLEEYLLINKKIRQIEGLL